MKDESRAVKGASCLQVCQPEVEPLPNVIYDLWSVGGWVSFNPGKMVIGNF
jgi:hypothetical protein